MIVSKIPSLSNQKKLNDFKNKYINLYPDYLQEEIEKKLFLGFTNNNDTINQIYCYLDLIKDVDNPYKEFIELLNKYFNLNCNILEIGAGTLPILAKYIKESNNNCQLTLMDPLIIFDNIVDSTIIKEKFNINTNTEKYDLLIGYNPCAASEDIIKQAISNKKSFGIALCGCCFLPENYTERTPEKWHEYLLELACKLGNDNYKIYIEYFKEDLNIKYPVIIGKLKNNKNDSY